MNETKVINVRLTIDEIEKIDELAKADERSRAYMIRKLIRQALGEFQRSD
ncbi:MAG: CopG family transcriptional regulator [Synergistaceae bacterium]|nr:CopG family transcriptional regulator [Synergistaceae bacterium]